MEKLLEKLREAKRNRQQEVLVGVSELTELFGANQRLSQEIAEMEEEIASLQEDIDRITDNGTLTF
jgi:predicted  nucleic acid-binding Zn-ribbon protein